MNVVTLTGNLVKDAEIKGGDGWQMAIFTIAVNENKKKGEEWFKETSYFDCKTFSKKDFNVLKKGQGILVEGKLHQDKWQTKDGKNASKVIIDVKDFQPLASRKAMQETAQQEAYASEDIPF